MALAMVTVIAMVAVIAMVSVVAVVAGLPWRAGVVVVLVAPPVARMGVPAVA